MTQLPVQTEENDVLAQWLGVDEVILIREDLLPDGGGKKRRALSALAEKLTGINHVHLLSYAGSHTAFTLSQLLPQASIHLYGTQYGGGAYEDTMVQRLNSQSNIIQILGSSLSMTLDFIRQKSRKPADHHFMKIGGQLGVDPVTEAAVTTVITETGSDYHHFVAVASGDLLKCVRSKTDHVTGILTQPLGIRLLKSFTLKNVRGLKQNSLNRRIEIMREIQELTGSLWDPVFMGTVFSYLKTRKKLPAKLGIWITCPSGVDWDAGNIR